MTAKEKADELINRFDLPSGLMRIEIIQCALFCVDELIKQNGELNLNSLGKKTIEHYKKVNSFLFEVKKELEKL